MRLKVLLVVTLSELGGAQKVLYHLVAGLDQEKYDLTVACAPGGELVAWLKALEGVRVVEMAALKREVSPAADLSAFFALYRLMRRERFSIVHCHSSKAGILGRLAAYLAGVPGIIFTVHGWGINEHQSRFSRLVFTLAERLAGRLSSRVVCVSRADGEKGIREKLAPPGKLAVIYNGVPVPPVVARDRDDAGGTFSPAVGPAGAGTRQDQDENAPSTPSPKTVPDAPDLRREWGLDGTVPSS